MSKRSRPGQYYSFAAVCSPVPARIELNPFSRRRTGANGFPVFGVSVQPRIATVRPGKSNAEGVFWNSDNPAGRLPFNNKKGPARSGPFSRSNFLNAFYHISGFRTDETALFAPRIYIH